MDFPANQLFLISGPCAIEGRDMAFTIASELVEISKDLNIPLVFKGSYRKANRSSINSFTGIGDLKALKILTDIKYEFDIPVTTDVHSVEEARTAAEYVDVLQIPAFLCRQTDLIVAAAKTGKIVNIKKGQFMSASSMKFAAQKVIDSGNNSVWLTERGTTFGLHDLVVDFRGITEMRSFGHPVIMDCTHALQTPNQSSGVTGGKPEMIETIAKAAVAIGTDGLFLETHPNPETAQSDGANMLRLSEVRGLLTKLLRIREAL